METYTLDFESFYDGDYSLSKISTEDYVFGLRFEIICVTLRTPTGNVEFFTGTEDETKKWLEQFELHKHAVVAHNMRFDGLILARLGIFPAFYLDTYSMARSILSYKMKSLSLASLAKHFNLGVKGDDVVHALGKRRADFSPDELRRYIQYCANDTALTYTLYRKLRELTPPAAIKDELQAIDQTLRMYLQPTLILDGEKLDQNLADVRERKRAKLAELEVAGITADVLRSNEKFANLLKERGIEPPMKISKAKSLTAGHPVLTYAFSKTDPEFIELQEEFAEDLEITMILNGRISEKSTQEETRTTKLGLIAKLYRWLRVPLAYYKAHTGRYGGDEGINMQNPPRIDKSKMRFAILPPPGDLMIVADLSQIEARITATLAGQNDLVEEFRAGEDVYSNYGNGLFGLPPGTITKKSTDKDIKQKRFVSKESILGLGFGMAAPKYRNALRGKGGLNLPLDVVEGYVEYYRKRYDKIAAYEYGIWARLQSAFLALLKYGKETQFGPVRVCMQDGVAGITGPTGLRLWYPHLKFHGYDWTFRRPSHKVDMKIFGGMWMENIAQFLANTIIKQKMLRITKELGMLPRMQAHDAIAWHAPTADAPALAKKIEAIMGEPPTWWPELPVAAEVKVGATYGDV